MESHRWLAAAEDTEKITPRVIKRCLDQDTNFTYPRSPVEIIGGHLAPTLVKTDFFVSSPNFDQVKTTGMNNKGLMKGLIKGLIEGDLWGFIERYVWGLIFAHPVELCL